MESTQQAKLWKKVDISSFAGTFITLGDLDGDRRVDFLLSYLGPYSSTLHLIALDHDGNKMWEFGDERVKSHGNAVKGEVNPCRGICTIYDFDGDGRQEVVVEMWDDGNPGLYLLDGETGEVRCSRSSPFTMEVREPEGYRSSRPAPFALVAHTEGADSRPQIIIKYEASNTIPSFAYGLNHRLDTIWELEAGLRGIGHHVEVVDLDGDGCEEVLLGQTAVNGKGEVIFEKNFDHHADMVETETFRGKKMILISICNEGPLYCLSSRGDFLWQKTRKEVPHGQSVWTGNFIPEREGMEVLVLRSGHYGDFMCLDLSDGKEISAFEHRAGLVDEQGNRKYPDMPVRVRWVDNAVDSLWVPVDRSLVDGRGRLVGKLGSLDAEVERVLGCGTKKKRLACQAIAADLCGDDRDEIVLYQPYHGEALYIFTQPDSSGSKKPYRHSSRVYNRKSYF